MADKVKLPSDVSIRRKSDGMYLYTSSGALKTSPTPKFLSSRNRAILSVRSDMGLDLAEVEFITRGDLGLSLIGGGE